MITLDGTLGITTPSETNTGTLAVTGVTTLTGGLNAALPVLSGGTGVTTSTGSGANVLGTSPTLTTPTFDSASLVTISGTAPLYMCRAWVNFDGTAASPITARASANISSITKASTSDYTINFTTALVDANYSIVAVVSPLAAYGGINVVQLNSARSSATIVAPTTSAFVLSVVNAVSGVGAASGYVNVAVFR